jgi:hypothetical protein
LAVSEKIMEPGYFINQIRIVPVQLRDSVKVREIVTFDIKKKRKGSI